VWHHYLNFREKNSTQIAAIASDGVSLSPGVQMFRGG
jgi:hypothetical protein